MRAKLTTLLTVIGAVTVLVLAANTVALATTGKALIAGAANTSTKVTAISRTTAGSALQLKTTSSTAAPLSVNGQGKVINLHADKVDGFDGGTRALSWVYAGPVTGDQHFQLNGLAVGTYLVVYEVYMDQLSTSNGPPVYCYARQTTGGTTYGGATYGVETDTNYPVLSGSALMTQPTGGDLGVVCDVEGAATWTAPANEPVRITAIPLAGVTAKGAPTLP